ncbi:proline--tRNA ligase [Candidatus Pacearchaeota archaeon]|nr:proline--tRNA ligase [Candidatus Pacearchaeota archaeon]
MAGRQEKDEKGVTAEKDEFSEWFTQIMLKADLADYTAVSGCIAFRPTSYAIWEKIRDEVDKRFKKEGIKNVYFPLFIPEKVLSKEAEHVEGFTPEVAWVTHAGESKLKERLAIRPTSETIMYDSFSKWIRSWRDLPMRLNQWNNVVRWEFKHPVPFLRTREFLWNEGHTVFASKEEAEAEMDFVIGTYDDVCRNFLALPSLIGRKSDKEKFAGAEYTVSMEFLMPHGKAIQGPDFHHDGQIFAKAYDITFLNEEGKKEYAYQNTFAITTRMLGVMFAIHSDKNGLVLPPRIAPTQAVIVPILFDDSRDEVLTLARDVEEKLSKFEVLLDLREEHKPGYKFNEWELKGVPLRIEVGPKDVERKEVVLVRRDTGKKEAVKVRSLAAKVERMLEEIQESLLEKAEKFLRAGVVEAKDLLSVEKVIRSKKIAFVPLCRGVECEDMLKYKSGGAKVLNIPFDGEKRAKGKTCVVCGKKADYLAYVGKSY